MEYVKGNIVKDYYPFIVHQVNCKGVMGAGLAKQIRNEWPWVYREYMELCTEYAKKGESLLGHIMISSATGLHAKRIVGLFAQDGYGRNKRYTDYSAFRECLKVLKKELDRYGGVYNSIAFPYGIGCGLAGGDWNIIQDLIKDFESTIKQKVYIVSLE